MGRMNFKVDKDRKVLTDKQLIERHDRGGKVNLDSALKKINKTSSLRTISNNKKVK